MARIKHVTITTHDVEKTADLIFILVEGAYYYLSMVSDKLEYNTRIEHYQRTVLAMLNIQDQASISRISA